MIVYIIFAIIAVIVLSLIIIANHFVNKLLIKTNKKLFERKESGKEESEEKKRIKEQRRIWFESSQKDVYTTSSDNLKLHAHLINNNSNVYVIIVHPYEARGSYMKYFIEKFYNMGFNILAIDLRTHGESEGKIYSLGYLERLDVLAWIKYINDNYNNSQIILYGISMGANAVMMCCNEDNTNNVKAIIEDAGFTNAYEQLKRRLDMAYKFSFLPIVEATSLMAKIRLGFSFKYIDVKKRVAMSKIPILFIHGDKDELVDYNMVNKLYDACSSEKEKLIIKDGHHISAVFSNENLYWNTIKNFISKYIS
ncbi:alpha/beta hydrolase [Brachyspira hyodysenteriae]|uniref:alpha/beta hydrolase n=1 Tax=Brachyspira hyodysenteriae TaxID=159 RepID=UPI00063D99DE|nr:alpha/beta hydrolase [Brachyspira hyodysenteriae]KLI60332.1 alpha/beta hydrolase [Brachyspira hyodysenteriae]